MKPSLLFLLITSIPMIDILISFKTNQYPKTMPRTKVGRSVFALLATTAWTTSLVFTILDYF
ncbi:MAG: hypothetical protein HOA15_05110 [Candidatus Marinimicrobia bacterium]|nr:hypothetical protein [Candidatus Neomarinimicrobiota bacterium]MBT3675279.1 hypothetical protein [Candidatus Neomarinimicrobiota bacterium]MBT3763268.1 hypothetical protein [Candidatus Neomarinimicrobiota bacterium]MBT4068763.1 hypothetical protein [Candidatus Neomarinimicrobiota bacterium]MBT4270561.1 hypothetical protein [Candidatus Neomarinimicrobiota bacterium]